MAGPPHLFTGKQANTPGWRSTRRAVFMVTDNVQPHFWLLEDIQLRCQIAADTTQQALAVGDRILSLMSESEEKELFKQIQKDADYYRRVCMSYALHIRETNIAQQLRADIKLGKPLNKEAGCRDEPGSRCGCGESIWQREECWK